jgi:glucose-1-phosphate cytidylyltransferase
LGAITSLHGVHMKVVILAGGFGTRISEETALKPKPLVEIGDKPILWHIMKLYSFFGFNDFGICLGYRGYAIKEYFANYLLYNSDVTFDFRKKEAPDMKVHAAAVEPWNVSLVDTGLTTMTGGRVKRMREHINGETFMLTYGDGIGNIDIRVLLDFHRRHGKLCTVTATQPSGRFGALDLAPSGEVTGFCEKPKGDRAWVSAGFFVMEPEVLDYIEGDDTVLEKSPLERLANDGQLVAFTHEGFWHPMDTLRDKNYLDDLWQRGTAPWKIWGNA